jgi:TM2 domain-containing membrane protein YozV
MTYDASGPKRSREARTAPPRHPHPAAAALLSSLVAGAGQMYRGEIRDGLYWLVVVKSSYGAGLLVLFLTGSNVTVRTLLFIGVFLHVACIVHAAGVTRTRTPGTSQT